MGSHQPEVSQQTQPHLSSQEPTCTNKFGGQTSDESKPGPEGHGQLLSPSQKDIQTLQDLVELAREGLTLTQWNLDTGKVSQAAEQPGKFWQLCALGSFSYTGPDCGCTESEPWQHPQVVGVDPRGDTVGAHFPAIRCRYNQPDVSEMIHKYQLLRESLDSIY